MLLKRLEISGFKSFAKAATLEFPTRITAIVGPNGSGKSNIADAIRWVLGEQSMKHLRGKKGEDLIFGGGGDSSSQVARLSKASVSLVFDNKHKIFPAEFDELILSRRVYRDGVNDYVLNDSQVRLKDIIELLSKVGLGASQHHIIAQGDADRILYASPKERKGMVEEALGLKIFELKRGEAQKKLNSTEENLKQVESLKREIQPHIKYLHSQAEKMKSVSEVRKQLEELSAEYVTRELTTLDNEDAETEKGKAPLQKKIHELEASLKESESLLGKENGARKFFEELKKFDEVLEALTRRRRELEREIGRLEFMAKSPTAVSNTIPVEKVKEILIGLASELESVSRLGAMESVRNAIFETTQKIYSFLESINGQQSNASQKTSLDEAETLKRAKEAISKLEAEEEEVLKKKKAIQSEYEMSALKVQKEGSTLRQKTDELSRLKDSLREFAVREEKVSLIRKELDIDFTYLVRSAKPAGEFLNESERTVYRKKIERFRIRLEESGVVDESVLKEYDETKKRDEFLTKESEDLRRTADSLKEIFEELESKISKDFDVGLVRINKLFGEFFHEIFGGGKAEIKMTKPKKIKEQSEEDEEGWQEEIEEESGLDIIVDIPRKRIKSLSMLSGGERALTSIALLFAMSTVNPPPFLVLDETDAALDEANSARYSSMLKELGKKTQLVVVTHNRETMKAADVLYGVTMGNDGVSKLLSIKFEEAENVLTNRRSLS